MKQQVRAFNALARRSPLLCLAFLLGLVACGGDDQSFRVLPVERGLSVREFGLSPDDPSPLQEAVAWVTARDASAILLHFTGVSQTELSKPGFDPGALSYGTLALSAVSEEGNRGFRRWEVKLPIRGDGEALVYFLEAQAEGDSLLIPAGGANESLVVSAQPIVIDFEWPDWPPLSQEIPCAGDSRRVLDGAEDQATLAGSFPFEDIRNPDWRRVGGGSILGNAAGVTQGVGVEWEGQYYFFPLAIMLWNEVSNQRMGSLQTALSYCPLTDTALLFDTGFDPDNLGKAMFYTPAGLFNSNLSVGVKGRTLIEPSPYNQMLGFAFAGPDVNRCLRALPSYQVDSSVWIRLHPETWILNGDTKLAEEFDWVRRDNPYSLYWRFHEELRAPVAHEDSRLKNKEHVLGILGGTDPVAIPMSREDFVHHTSVAGIDVVVFLQSGIAIALERRHPLTGAPMRFSETRAMFRGLRLYRDDSSEPSLWTMEGVAVSGPLKGRRLAWVPSMSAFWFAWYAIYPETRFELPGEG